MDRQNKTGFTAKSGAWIICPICHKPNPSDRLFCQYCWGAILRPMPPISLEQAERLAGISLAHLNSRKAMRILVTVFTSLIIAAAVVYGILYGFTDTVSKPKASVNSNSSPTEWAMFRHDLAHTGSSTSDVLPEGVQEWAFATGASIHSSPAVVAGTIYVGSQDGKLYAIDAATGMERWNYQTGSWVESSPAVANGIVYFGSNDGKLYALNAQTGEKIWDFKTRYAVMSSPAVAHGIVYFGTDDFHICALDALKGTKRWDRQTEGSVVSSPVVANGILYAGSGDGFLYALDALNGRLRLHFKTYQSTFTSPAVDGETIYFANSDGTLFAIDGSARSKPWEHDIRPFWVQVWAMGWPIPFPPLQSGYLWALDLNAPPVSSPVIGDGVLYIGSGNKLLAIDSQSHQRLWEFTAKGRVSSTPALAGSTVVVGSEDGHLYAVEAATGKELWQVATGDRITSSPAVVDGTVYIGSHDGKLYAIK
ncbi:MAG: PQQ-binding-like beta-propeller repeat protein [Chloroflexota bacterium]